jgi:hypothetical protein
MTSKLNTKYVAGDYDYTTYSYAVQEFIPVEIQPSGSMLQSGPPFTVILNANEKAVDILTLEELSNVSHIPWLNNIPGDRCVYEKEDHKKFLMTSSMKTINDLMSGLLPIRH